MGVAGGEAAVDGDEAAAAALDDDAALDGEGALDKGTDAAAIQAAVDLADELAEEEYYYYDEVDDVALGAADDDAKSRSAVISGHQRSSEAFEGAVAGVAAEEGEEASAEGAVAGVAAEEGRADGRAARRARHGARVAVSSEPEGVPATAPAWQRLAALDAAASGDDGAEAGGFYGSTVELKLAVI